MSVGSRAWNTSEPSRDLFSGTVIRKAKNDLATSTRRIDSAVERAQFRLRMIMCMCEGGCGWCSFFPRGPMVCASCPSGSISDPSLRLCLRLRLPDIFPTAASKMSNLSDTFPSISHTCYFLLNSQMGDKITWDIFNSNTK
jgi:hypothetical protein